MMNSYCFMSLSLITILTCFLCVVQPFCHSDDAAVLLQFKDNFIIRSNASYDLSAYPKTDSWNLKSKDCCQWDGVECDASNTLVVALHLNSSCLYGNIKADISRLSHLQILDLSDNHFSDSPIPSMFGQLSSLTYLNLSYSALVGPIPVEIARLSNLSYLDLSCNQLYGPIPAEISQLSSLSYLNLFHNNLSSEVPSGISKLTNLVFLRLSWNNLHGEFPNGVFHLPKLQKIGISKNEKLTGSLPEFDHISPLTIVSLSQTSFSGVLPSSMKNLKSLLVFAAEHCKFSGPLPSSFGSLYNLQYLNLYDNRLSGEIPSSIGNLSQLALLHLDGNLFTGHIPQSLASLSNLESLILNSNYLKGNVDFFSMFRNMTYLYDLELSYNMLTVKMETRSDNMTNNPMLEYLYLASCNLTSFPISIRRQDRLTLLDLNANNIHGKVPRWIGNDMSLQKLFASGNLLTGFDGIDIFTRGSLRMLEISHNNLLGPLPIPPPSILQYDVSHNQLTGEITNSFCNLSTVLILDFSHNRLSGSLPSCLRNLSASSLVVMDAQNNSLSSVIPQMCETGSKLRIMDLSHNNFRGLLPLSLANCSKLEVLNLGNNQLKDVFPSWLSTLSELKLLNLRSNRLHGATTSNSGVDSKSFPSLRIIDVSHNNLTGSLPSHYIRNWNSMKDFDARNSSYLNIEFHFIVDNLDLPYLYDLSMTITNKGRDMEYPKIEKFFTVIDFSSNRFQGDIPECIGNLLGLQVLNLSNNLLTGKITSSLGNIRQLESLDLSRNDLSGEIPQTLAGLTFLEFFNVSFNRLEGQIPQGSQLSTFDISSYEGNEGLEGFPLTKMHTPSPTPSPTTLPQLGDQDSTSFFRSNWFTILPGLFGGLVVGVTVEHALANNRHQWFRVFSKFWT